MPPALVKLRRIASVAPRTAAIQVRQTSLSILSGGGALPIRAVSDVSFEHAAWPMTPTPGARRATDRMPEQRWRKATAGTCGSLTVRARYPGGVHCQTN
jgi:hypothetical protein